MSLLRRKLYQQSFSLLAEPHEICDEESLGPVVWKETPAGDAAAVRCPRNATGKGDCMVGRWPLIMGSFILCVLGEESLCVLDRTGTWTSLPLSMAKLTLSGFLFLL